MDLTSMYLKKRISFGRQPMFCEQGPEMCDAIESDPKLQSLFILRNPVHQASQNTPVFSEHTINTVRAKYSMTAVNHSEGGWPKDVHVWDVEATQRYRRKVEKEDDYINCVVKCVPELEHYVLQNNAIDMYQTYYTEIPRVPPLEKNSMRTVNAYQDPFKRPVSSICWHPEGSLLFAVSYVDMDFNRQSNSSLEAYIWDSAIPGKPTVTFYPPSILLDLQYNPKDPTMLAGGLVTGQVALFDSRKAGTETRISPPHVAHRDIVRNVLFISCKSGMEFFSGGADGVCKWWDARNLSEPIDEMVMDLAQVSSDLPNMATARGISVLEYEHTIPTRFMIGTDNGYVFNANRKGKSQLDKIPIQYEAHHGQVRSVMRNPFFLKYFLTVGDWRFCIWSEECRDSPILSSHPMRYKITCGTWSPQRCSLLLCSGEDGVLTAWDLLRCQNKPVVTMSLSKNALSKINFQDNGTLAAVGTEKGCVILVELSKNMTMSDKHDKSFLMSIFERESRREKILEARLREIRLKLRQAEEASPRHSIYDDPAFGDRDLIEATQDYFGAIKRNPDY